MCNNENRFNRFGITIRLDTPIGHALESDGIKGAGGAERAGERVHPSDIPDVWVYCCIIAVALLLESGGAAVACLRRPRPPWLSTGRTRGRGFSASWQTAFYG